MKEKYVKLKEKTNPDLRNQLDKLYQVVYQALDASVHHQYDYKLPERKILSQNTPPHVQAVNQMLDRKEVELSYESRRLIELQHRIVEKTTCRQTKVYRDAIFEAKIADSFKRQDEKTLQQYSKLPLTEENIAKCKEQRGFDLVGHRAHMLFGMFKQAANPYDAIDDTLGQGARYDYEEMDFEKKFKF